MKNNRVSYLIWAFVFFLFACAIFYLFYRTINYQKISTKVMHDKWQQEENRREIIKTLDRSIKEIQQEKSSIESHFVSSNDIVPFLDFFEHSALLLEAKAEVNSVAVTSDDTSIVVDLKLKGSFDEVYRYMKLIESAPYELQILSFLISRNDTQESLSPQWDLNINVKLLSYNPQK